MNYRQRLFFWLVNMTAVVFLTAGLSIYILYQTAIREQKTRLAQTAKTQAQFLESMYRTTGNPKLIEATVTQASKLQGNSQTERLTIGQLFGNQIVLINQQSQSVQPTSLSVSDTQFQSMNQALHGYSGVMSDFDYKGVEVIAAYEPVSNLGWGVVAKTDLNQLRAPYIRAGIKTLFWTCLLNGLGVFLILRLYQPIVKELKQEKGLSQDYENRLLQLNQQFQQELAERQRLEEVLQRELDLLARIMETSPVGILMVEPSGEIVVASKQAEQMLGLIKTEQSYQMPPWQASDETGQIIYEQKHLCKQVFESRQSIRDVRELIEFPDGHQLLVSINASPVIDETTRVEGVVFTVEDITERVQVETALLHSETQFRAIFEQASVGISIISLSGQFIRVNQRYCDLTGYSEAELQEKTDHELSHPEDIEPKTDLHQIHRFSKEKRYIRKDQSIIWVHLSGSVVKDQNGQPMYMISIIEDVSERKQTQEALQKANTQLTAWIRELEQRNQDILLLNQISDFLQACLTVEEAYQVIGERLPSLFTESSGGLFMISHTNDLVEAVATWGEELHSATSFVYEECWALRRGKTHWIHSTSQVVCQHVHLDLDTVQQSLCVPMMAQGKAIGLLYLYHTEQNFSRAKQQLAQTVAEHLSLALANLKLRETLQAQSIIDPLTNLYNRRYLEESLKREINLAKRKRHPVGVIMLDVDHFRQFNQTFGHEGGNCALQAVGVFLSSQIRSGDIACRYGGEEFLLILPEASLEISVARAEQIRQGIKQLQVSYGEQTLSQITASIGIACFPDHGKTMEDLIKAADQALYQAKYEGRDRVIRYTA